MQMLFSLIKDLENIKSLEKELRSEEFGKEFFSFQRRPCDVGFIDRLFF